MPTRLRLQHAASTAVIRGGQPTNTHTVAQMPDLWTKDFLLFFSLMNPFLMSIYLLDLILNMDAKSFFKVLCRGSLIATVAFVLLAISGEALFKDILQVRFSSFQLFGGVVFLIIALRFVFQGASALAGLRGDPEHVAGSIAMPFMIGPGTVSASVVIGSHQQSYWLSASVLVSVMVLTVTLVTLLKVLHDYVKQRNARLINRYIEVVGRISALISGTIAVDMILTGIEGWMKAGKG
jgi:multiple antibiotic resistance protein